MGPSRGIAAVPGQIQDCTGGDRPGRRAPEKRANKGGWEKNKFERAEGAGFGFLRRSPNPQATSANF